MSGTLAAAKRIAIARPRAAAIAAGRCRSARRGRRCSCHHGGVALRHDDFVSVGVEGEIAVRLGRDHKPSDAPFTADAAARAI
jgi:hypothetical protein